MTLAPVTYPVCTCNADGHCPSCRSHCSHLGYFDVADEYRFCRSKAKFFPPPGHQRWPYAYCLAHLPDNYKPESGS